MCAGSRWYIENYRNAHELELCDIEQKQSAFVSKCVDSTLTVPHKINAIGLNGCSKTNLIVDDVISGIDVTNCDCIAIKINGSCKSVSIDRCHTVQIYLMTAASYDCQIFYCEARNVKVFLAKDGDEEPTELTVNDLWKTTYDAATGTLVTVPSEAAAVN